jgi:hypothetical protein
VIPNSNILVIQEFRVSRYQVLVFQCLLYLIFIPLLINILALLCFALYLNTEQEDIFKFVFRKEALSELQDFEQQLYFDYFSSPTLYDNSFQTGQQDSQLSVSQSIVNSDLKSDLNQFTNTFPESVKLAIQRKTVDLATI